GGAPDACALGAAAQAALRSDTWAWQLRPLFLWGDDTGRSGARLRAPTRLWRAGLRGRVWWLREMLQRWCCICLLKVHLGNPRGLRGTCGGAPFPAVHSVVPSACPAVSFCRSGIPPGQLFGVALRWRLLQTTSASA